jgi:hypothetical protein
MAWKHPVVPEIRKEDLDRFEFDPKGPANQFMWEGKTGFGVQVSPKRRDHVHRQQAGVGHDHDPPPRNQR